MKATRERSKGTAIAERRVLLGIEDLEHRGRRIALDAAAHLVDLVEHHHAIAGAGLLDTLDDVAGEGADVGAAMAADFGLVVHAAEADAYERLAHRAGDRLPQRSLADAGRTREAEDGRFALGRELAHGQIFDDARLDLLESEMILVEDPACFGDVDGLLRRNGPRELDEPVQIRPDHSGLARGLGHPFVSAELLLRLAVHLGGHLRLRDGFRQFGDFLRLAVAFAELALDGRHLFPQDRFALALVERGFGLLTNLVGEAQHLEALGQELRDLFHPFRDVDRLKDLLLLLRFDVEV